MEFRTLAWRCLACVMGCLLTGVWSVHAEQTNSLRWQSELNRVDADIDGVGLTEVLGWVSAATGWEVYVEPGTERQVRTRFKERTPDKALDLLLGDLSRVLLPPTNKAMRLLVFQTSERHATHKVDLKKSTASREKKTKPIANELVITVKPGTDVEALARSLGAKIVGRIDSLNAYRLQFEDEASALAAREALKNRGEVLSVDSNYPVYRDLPMRAGEGGGAFQLGIKAVPDGERIIVGLIDTMLDAEKSGFKDLMLPGISVADTATHPGTQPMHGDSMLQALLRSTSFILEGDGAAVRVLPVDVYGSAPMTSTFAVSEGIAKAVNAGAMIINLSLSSEWDAPILRQVIQSGASQDVLFFAAAGNEPGTTPTYPAAYEEVISVTARDAAGGVASYANSGEFVDVSAPGTTLVTFNGLVWQVGGTSVSTATVTGIASGLKQRSGVTWKELGTMIRTSPALKPKAGGG